MIRRVGRLRRQLAQQLRSKSILACLHRPLSLMAPGPDATQMCLLPPRASKTRVPQGSLRYQTRQDPATAILEADPMAVKKQTRPASTAPPEDVLALFHPVTAAWFRAVFEQPTAPQRLGWPAIARGESTLILAPTGTGKTLTAFLWCLDRLMLHRKPDGAPRAAASSISAP